jgi:sulfite exporter TauE/SafE
MVAPRVLICIKVLAVLRGDGDAVETTDGHRPLDHSAHIAPFLAGDAPSLVTAAELALALFLTGLAGGFAHCGAMCSPFVLAQLPVGSDTPAPRLARLASGALLPYHLGRLTTYTLLGGLAGGLGGMVVRMTGFKAPLAILLLLAACLFLAQALGRLLPTLADATSGKAGRWVGGKLTAIVGPLLRQSRGRRGYLLGVALGFLPCGFLYAALAAAAGAGSAGAGAAAMASFCLGTVPSLLAVGLVGAAAARRWRFAASRLAVPVLLLNALLLTRTAIGILA